MAKLSKVGNESFGKRNELLLRMFSKTFGNKSIFKNKGGGNQYE
ncbi:hypothetical protein CHCC20488_0391 [Bacillus paralicheniformis]|uniref:Uncharacterized protein n=1 Tax=Bacillus paralicheniformis TaxID=1648923 RepID=A0A6I7UG57_9BACI|nr:hypothetical protein SC10_B2orf00899 [Bacillus paralicheniformis]OLF90926.1 hypothetical protein B4121_3139 [Bacillus paralicheniformis]OLG01313.1 hypothetical protein B4125_3813 [Bacillus paralicheniformis]TWJ39882.1 hypothetical protein CHCC5027_1463 [Bacillus paralicheniformis]TWJ68442.1 hypothetical protein CHCC4186_4077 [Bacillus paralicheniformis]